MTEYQELRLNDYEMIDSIIKDIPISFLAEYLAYNYEEEAGDLAQCIEAYLYLKNNKTKDKQ